MLALWRIFLVIYFVSLTIIFLLVLKETLSSIEKLDTLEDQLTNHIKHVIHDKKKEGRARRTMKKKNKVNEKEISLKYAMNDFLKTYKKLPLVEEKFKKKLLILDDKLKLINKR